MKFEPQTFFIGIIDLFSIMLPGALATALVKRAVEPVLFPAVFPTFVSESARWAVFLFASYLLGHFIFLLGSFLDEFIYDRLRTQAKDEEATLLKKIKGLLDELNRDGKNGLLNQIASQVQAATDAPQQEQLLMLEKIEKAVEQIRGKFVEKDEPPAALNTIHKALHQYFRNRNSRWHRFCRWLLKHLFAENPDLALNRVLEIKSLYVAEAKGKVAINSFQWAKARLTIHCPTALVEVQRLEADSKFFRSLVVVLVPLAGWLLWKAFQGNLNWLVALSCLVFICLSFWRYVERRFKATQQSYWYVITLEGCAASSNDKP